MKTTFQKIECKISGIQNGTSATAQYTGQLRQDYDLCSGVFFMNGDNDLLTCRLSIGGQEILPAGTNVSVFNFNGNFSRKEAMIDLSSQKIPARSSEFQIDFKNSSKKEANVTVYFELKSE